MVNSETILQIVRLIITKEDYLSASKIIKQNGLTLNILNSLTYKLTQRQLALLADNIIKNR